jgi:beta-xylosidase
MRFLTLLLLALAPAVAAESAATAAVASSGVVAPQPLYRDPVFDGAADPVVIWNPHVGKWWMFYTNRRANVPGLSGVAWVHGTPIGIAESSDGGATWKRVGDAAIDLPAAVRGEGPTPTYWAPDVITAPDGTHHMFLTVVPGVFENWQHPRTLVHLTSTDLRTWANAAPLTLASDRVIDACVYPLPTGGWRMWYNNERDRKSIYYADSPDLATWTDRGKCTGVGERPGEGPYVFRWRGAYWMLVDLWKGLGVYRSDDLQTWTAQPDNLLGVPGKGPDDGVNGGHPGVVVSGDRAFCFYFTHPGRSGTITPQDKDSLDLRRSSIQVVELIEQNGRLTCDRDTPTHIALVPPVRPRAATDPDPAALAQLRALGARGIRAHDPSTLVKCKDEYWIFHTGRGVPSWRSKDLVNWTTGPRVFEQAPAWVAEAVPENRNAMFWAPDVARVGDRYFLYYSVSSFGKRTSALALATNTTLDPADPAFRWVDEGIVVRSSNSDNFNAIDPAITRDAEGRLWLVFGSFWSGIKLVELDPATGKRLSPDAPLHALAHQKEIEAAFIYRHGGHYYLFVNHGKCCRGLESTYHIVVGRAEKITGPYIDREGKALLAGGGTPVLDTDGPFIGPGHAGIFAEDGREWFGCHFYDGTTPRGTPGFALRPLAWDDAGWPVVGKSATSPALQSPR